MSVISRLAVSLGRKDEIPNQELAKQIVLAHDLGGVKELVSNLSNKDSKICSDCIKALYEIGYLDPLLISPYADDFIHLLFSRQNRLVWGAMMALSVIAPLVPNKLFAARERIMSAMKEGSVITIDNGVKALALVAADNPDFKRALLPYLLDHLKRCRSKEVPQHAESISVCISKKEGDEFASVLNERIPEMTTSQSSRIKHILKAIGTL